MVRPLVWLYTHKIATIHDIDCAVHCLGKEIYAKLQPAIKIFRSNGGVDLDSHPADCDNQVINQLGFECFPVKKAPGHVIRAT